MIDHRRATAAALVIAGCLALPSAVLPRFGDDYAQLLAVEGSTSLYKGQFSRYDLFVFANGVTADVRSSVERGALPWWSHPSLKISFFRPLSSALMVADHALFGRGTVGPHLHSALWYLALVAVVGLLLRRALPGSLVLGSLLLFALDDAHSLPVMWLANRNALVAATLGFLGVHFHLRAREEQKRWAHAVSAGLCALGLLAGEIALGAVGYVIAYELTRTDEGLAKRSRALLPVAAVCAAWLLAYKLLGYGASGALMYIDPVSQPWDWIGAVASRGPVLVGALFPGIWGELWNVTPRDGRFWLVGASLGASALFFFALWRLSRSMEPLLRQRVWWMSLGSIFAVLPVSSTFPSGRLLIAASLGSSVVVAAMIQGAWRARGWRLKGITAAAGAGLLVLLHVVLALPQWAFSGALMHLVGKKSDRMNSAVLASIDPASLPRTRMVTLWSDPLSALNAAARLSLETSVDPRAWWLLSIAPGDHAFTRTGPSTLEMELVAPERRLLGSEPEQFLRAPPLPMPREETFPGMRVEVAEEDPAGIKRLRFTFDAPLEDASLVFFHWSERELTRLVPPAIGTRWIEKEPPPL
jgi:hypothetical protein